MATPNRLRSEHAVAALRAGKHVVVEKPFALSPQVAQEMTEVARGRVVAPFYTRHQYLAARE